MPAVSVLMPVYNGERYLTAALDSILIAQSLRDLELVVVDDRSTDATPRMLAERAATDPRVRLITLPARHGVAAALNRGLAEVRGALIARMDADDIAAPGRLAAQVAVLEARPRVGIVGSWVRRIDDHGLRLGCWRPATTDLALRWESLLEVPFCHPTVMVRRDVLDAHQIRYDETATAAEDYALFVRLLEVTEGANLPELLLLYRRHGDSVNARDAPIQATTHVDIAERTIARQFPELSWTREDVAYVLSLVPGVGVMRPHEIARSMHHYLDLWEAFASRHAGDPGLPAAADHVAVRLVWHFRSHARRMGLYTGFLGVGDRAVRLLAAPLARALAGEVGRGAIDRWPMRWDHYRYWYGPAKIMAVLAGGRRSDEPAASSRR